MENQIAPHNGFGKNDIIVLVKEPHKFGSSNRVFVVVITEDGKRFANTAWLKEGYRIEESKTIDSFDEAIIKFDGVGEIGDDIFVEIHPNNGWVLWERTNAYNSFESIIGKDFSIYKNQAYRDARIFHQDNKYAYGVYLTNPKKSNRPFVIKLQKTGAKKATEESSHGHLRDHPIPSFINLPDGWTIVGNIRPKDFKSKSDDFKDGLFEVLSDTTFWDSDDYQYDEYIRIYLNKTSIFS